MDPQTLYTAGLTNFMIALASVITAVGVVWVNVIVARAKTKVEQTAEVVIKKADDIAETTKVTLGHVNSAATKMLADLEALRNENQLLRRNAAENKEIASLLAARTAASTPRPADAHDRKSDTGVLDAIEQHTKDTAENTARTEAAVSAAVEKAADLKAQP